LNYTRAVYPARALTRWCSRLFTRRVPLHACAQGCALICARVSSLGLKAVLL